MKKKDKPQVGDIWAFDDFNGIGPPDPCLLVKDLGEEQTWTGLIQHHFLAYNIVRNRDENIVFADFNKSYWKKLG